MKSRTRRLLVSLLGLLISLSGCGATKQVVVPQASVADLRSPAWIVHSVPSGAKMPDEEVDD